MTKEMVYKAKIDRIFFPNGIEIFLKNKSISMKLKGDSELAVKESTAFYYNTPYYILMIEINDYEINRVLWTLKKKRIIYYACFQIG